MQFAIPTTYRGLNLSIGSTCETIWSTLIGNERTTSTISSRTWMERPHDADTRKSDTDHCTRPQSPLQADRSYLSLPRTVCDLTYPRKRVNRRRENASTRGTLPLLATPPSLVTNSACRLPANQLQVVGWRRVGTWDVSNPSFGAPGRNRTCCLSVRSRTLCPVSYRRDGSYPV